MAVTSNDAWAPMRVDCLSVQQGAQKDFAWANAPGRMLARVWRPLCAALDDNPHRVVWMPAHCTQKAVGTKVLSNGELLTASDLNGNALVDKLAKEAAGADRLPRERRDAVRKLGADLAAVATWIGQATYLANHFPDPRQSSTGTGKQQFLRDSTGSARKRRNSALDQEGQREAETRRKPKPRQAPGALAGCERWDALRARIQARQQESNDPPQSSGCLISPLGKREVEHVGTMRATQRHAQKRQKFTDPALGFRDRMVDPCTVNATPTSVGSSQPRPVSDCGAGVENVDDDEDVILLDLLELQASGCKVILPSRLPAEPLVAASTAASSETASQGWATAPAKRAHRAERLQCSEVLAAEDELVELERYGLKVKR